MAKKMVVLFIVLMAVIGLSGIAAASISVDNNKKDTDKGKLIVGDKGKIGDKITLEGKGKGIGKNRRKSTDIDSLSKGNGKNRRKHIK